MGVWIVLGASAMAFAACFALALCRAAKRGDEMQADCVLSPDDRWTPEEVAALQEIRRGYSMRFVPLSPAPIREDVCWLNEPTRGADGAEVIH